MWKFPHPLCGTGCESVMSGSVWKFPHFCDSHVPFLCLFLCGQESAIFSRGAPFFVGVLWVLGFYLRHVLSQKIGEFQAQPFQITRRETSLSSVVPTDQEEKHHFLLFFQLITNVRSRPSHVSSHASTPFEGVELRV